MLLRILSFAVAGAALPFGAASSQTTAPAGQSTEPAEVADPVVVATVADIKPGVKVNDEGGQPVGTIESVTADGAVVATGSSRAQLPLTSFAKKGATLIISLTKAELDAAVADKTPPAS